MLIQLPPVQTWLVRQVTNRLSHDLHTTIRIRHVDFSLFNKMLLQGALVEDDKKDTLLYAGTVKVNITDWWFFKDKAQLKYIGLENATVKLQRTDSIWNYQFIVDYFSKPPPTSPAIKDTTPGMQLDLKEVDLSNIHFLKRDSWRGEDMDLRLSSMQLDADTISFSQKIARLNSLTFTRPDFTILNYDGNRPHPPLDTEKIVNDPHHLRLNPGEWDLTAGVVSIKNGSFRHEEKADTVFNKYFDGNHIFFSAVNTSFSKLRLNRDTITAQLLLSTKERSGLEVKKLSANIKWFPEAMEFHRLDLVTNRSHLRNFFAMRFTTLDDMSDFETRIRMEGRFTDAEIDSDDISFFAPALRDWKKHIRMTGDLQGTVANLQGRKVVLEAGKNTLLNGDIHLKGLPYIDTTRIEFKSNDFRTTYSDMVALVPSIKSVGQPRIDRVEWLRFKGDFTGTIHDFITKGTIETNLGNIVTNVDMQFPDNGPSVYSGTLATDSFHLGAFLDNDNLGSISFQGKIKGAGLRTGTLNATLDGTITSLEFNQYTYQQIKVNGTVAKKKFNGELVSGDPNLGVHLNGLIDFSGGQPKFDFEAEVARASLARLHFTNQPVEFLGKLKVNFTGDDIDNFLGHASIYDASVFKNGNRVSFDSLTLESSIIDNNKTITVVSNEFDGAIVGEFSIKDLPASFQTFLNKYYPSYIKPAKAVPINQNFSFVITTKKVDEYIDLFNKDLKGFNNAALSGRIDTRDNLLDLNVDLPTFGYKNIAFENLTLKGRGNLDSLSMETTIGNVALSDSLRFPSTHIRLRSSNDQSYLQVTTSANQTLNSANISAHVQTLPTGVRLTFDPSTVDINSKTWSIDKDGELAFSSNVLSADALRLHNGDQEVRITTHPSGEGNWNDIHAEIKKVNIGDFTPYIVKSERIEGLLTGSVDMTDPFGKPFIKFTGDADQFRFANDSIGHLELSADYHGSTKAINATVHSDNKNYHLDSKILVNLSDSAAGPPIDIVTDVADTKVDLLEKYLGGIFTNLSGNATGKLRITGPSNHLLYLGTVSLRDASLKVAYTQCTYKIPSATIRFKADTIDFGSFQIKDKFGHTADLLRGRLLHHAFDDLSFDFDLNTNRFLLLDTKATDNNQFYGTVVGKARMTLSGPEENMVMNIKGEPTDSSNIYLPPSVSRESGEADFIVWKVYGKEMKKGLNDRKSSNLLVKLDMYANNYANVYMILDPLSGDIIKANGHGNLNMEVGTTKDLDLRGRYEIDRGNYNFTFQSFIHKPFILSEGVGNYISWSGDPYNADIGIQAVYKAENVRFSDLGLNNSTNLAIMNENVKRQRVTVLVTADLTGKLLTPNIKFHIDLPLNSPLKDDQSAQSLLQLIQNDPNELNKQVSTLVVLNSFVPLSNSSNNFDPSVAGVNVVVNSLSGAISNAFSKVLQTRLRRVFKDNSITVNFNTNLYNGTTIDGISDQTRLGYDRTNLNFSIAKSFINEKLTLTVGSALDFGMTTQQVQAASFQFLPDIAAAYKVTPDGRVALTFFYRDSYNYLSTGNHTQNSSGTSISYRRDFDRFDELFKKKKKKKAPQNPAPPANPPAQGDSSN
ncbi:MAG: translocation/assembly module TamB domain-containing protein [Bacteroidetes bacterium]|nr:translocation/assembly module TamB domain-containing protein [Bacteroidota bacterium]